MKLRVSSVVWLLPLFLSGCLLKPHRQAVAKLPLPASKIPKPQVLHPEFPLAAIAIPLEPVEDDDPDAEVHPAAPPVHHHRPPEKPAQVAENPPAPETPGVSAIGQLSSGEPTRTYHESLELIAATERGLKEINRPLSDQEKKTAAQIKQYLKQARQALNTGDVDGAATLAAKAQVLLRELTQ
jgi:hypothetical protein